MSLPKDQLDGEQEEPFLGPKLVAGHFPRFTYQNAKIGTDTAKSL